MAKSYDSVQHVELFCNIQDLGLPEQMVNAIEHMYSKSEVVTNFEGVTSADVDMHRGFVQGYLFPLLYILHTSSKEQRLQRDVLGFPLPYWEDGMKKAWRLPELAYMDNLVLLVETPEHKQRLLTICSSEADKRVAF